MAYAIYMVAEKGENRRYATIFEKKECATLKEARYWLTKMFRWATEKDEVNETQPTWNFEDKFHLYDKHGVKVVNLIAKKYKSDKMSLINKDLIWERYDDLTPCKFNYLERYTA